MADEQLDAFDVAAFAAATAAEQPGNRTRRSFQVMRRDDGAPCGPPGKMIRSADRICSADNMSQVRGFMTLGNGSMAADSAAYVCTCGRGRTLMTAGSMC